MLATPSLQHTSVPHLVLEYAESLLFTEHLQQHSTAQQASGDRLMPALTQVTSEVTVLC